MENEKHAPAEKSELNTLLADGLPKKLFYNHCSECLHEHGVGYKTTEGHRILFSMNYSNEYHKKIAEEIIRLWNEAHG